MAVGARRDQRRQRPGVAVKAELRAARAADGTAELRRFYWSTQQPDPRSPWGFSARTLYCDADATQPRLFEFPSEPALCWLGDDPDRFLTGATRSGSTSCATSRYGG